MYLETRAVTIPVRCKSMVISLPCFMASVSQSLLMNYIISDSTMLVGQSVCGLHAHDGEMAQHLKGCGMHSQ